MPRTLIYVDDVSTTQESNRIQQNMTTELHIDQEKENIYEYEYEYISKGWT